MASLTFSVFSPGAMDSDREAQHLSRFNDFGVTTYLSTTYRASRTGAVTFYPSSLGDTQGKGNRSVADLLFNNAVAAQ